MRFHPALRFILRFLVPCALVAHAAAAVRVTDLRCDWAVDPQGIDSAPPRLSWRLESVDRGAAQSAWQVQVGSSRDALVRNHPDIWDSGRVAGDRQLSVPQGGRALHTAERVYWRVRAWDNEGKESPWSSIATWTMGITDAADRRGQWITDPELLKLTRSKLGFSTPPVADENREQWLVLDLGRPCVIEAIHLHALVHTVSERLGFPRWFKVEVAADARFADATTVADHTRDGINVWFTRFSIPVPRVSARYVRLTATRLRMTDEEEFGRAGRLALRQIG